MKQYAMTAMLKNDECVRKYEEYHAAPWPQVLEILDKCGFRRIFIYRHGRQIFMFFETVDNFDIKRDMARYSQDPYGKKWIELMGNLLKPLPWQPRGSTWLQMKEIYTQDFLR